MLAETRSPTRAARAVGMTKEGAYALRRPDAESFAAAWDAVLARPPASAREPGLYERGVEESWSRSSTAACSAAGAVATTIRRLLGCGGSPRNARRLERSRD